MPLDIGMLMDPIGGINIKKDSSFAMLLECQRRGHRLHLMTDRDLWSVGDRAMGRLSRTTVRDDPTDWFTHTDQTTAALSELDVILMRKDPPFDMQYINDTYLLELAEVAGTLVVNRPQALRDMNEKAYIGHFPQCIPETMMARDPKLIREFVHTVGQAVVKPLDGMGGQSIFRVSAADPNLNVILETVSQDGQETIMAQAYVEEITAGDKRILIVDGEAVPFALARIPSDQDFRGNLARGGRGEGVRLSERDHWIAEQVGPSLKAAGVLFAGIDVIGDYLTEINVTSPTCIRELDQIFDLNIAGQLLDCIESSIG